MESSRCSASSTSDTGSPVVSSGPTVSEKVKVDDDVEVISVRSARARPRDQTMTNGSKHARSSAPTSRRSLSPSRDYPRGTSTVTRPSKASPKRAEDRPVHAQDLEVFKAHMTSMLVDMLQSSLSNFASQLKSSSGGQGESVSTQNVASDQEKEPSDHDDRSEGRDLASEEDPTDIPADPKLENLMMTEEEEEILRLSLLPLRMYLKGSPRGGTLKRIQNFILRPRFIIRTILLLARLGQ